MYIAEAVFIGQVSISVSYSDTTGPCY